MRNLWNDAEAATFTDPLGACIYASRLLGSERSLVLHGGGNTSTKTHGSDVFGDRVDVLWIKASGWNLGEINEAGFAPVDLGRIKRLAELESLPDLAMSNELQMARLSSGSPSPSVEAIVHAIIPAKDVLHTHPDALLAISNTRDGRDRMEALYGDRVIVVPYARSGFRVGRATAVALSGQLSDNTIGIMLMNHGLFTFADTSKQAYGHMIDLVSEAEQYIAENAHTEQIDIGRGEVPDVERTDLAALRHRISEVAGKPFIMSRHSDDVSLAFARDPNLESLASRGPVTPDHVIWTKVLPMFGRDATTYAEEYVHYYDEHKHMATVTRMLDPAPRVIFDSEFGMLTAGPDVASADAAGDIYLQTIEVIRDATALGGYVTLSHDDFFDVEYWELEQAKLDRIGTAGEFTGEVAVVTGAASGIGKACAAELLKRGAAVVGLDISASVERAFDDAAFLGVRCDLTSADATSVALDAAVQRFGGVDMLVAAAGIFPVSAPIAAFSSDAWNRAMSVNVSALALLFSLVHPLLSLSPRGGRVAVVGSKNVVAPGPGASAYSATKAAANQLTRVAALEWAPDGIRVNSVHPDAVFDTALWTDELLAERASRYGLSIEEYKRRNLLGVEIRSADVATVVAEILGDSFSRVTGAHIPIDGGNDRVI